jgi:hypothetical protein
VHPCGQADDVVAARFRPLRHRLIMPPSPRPVGHPR